MSRMTDGLIDLTVTSPPYDGLRLYNGYSFDFEGVARQLWRITKTCGVLVWVVADQVKHGSESGSSFRQALFFMSLGFRLHDTMIYAKNQYIPLTHNRYEQEFEYMFVFSKGKPKTFNPILIPSKTAGTFRDRSKSKSKEATYAERCREEKTTVKDFKIHGNIFKYDIARNDKNAHTAMFPEKLAEDHILTWSNKGDLIYDPFAGSGTTPKVAEANQRLWVASEISPEYCSIINERICGVQINGF